MHDIAMRPSHGIRVGSRGATAFSPVGTGQAVEGWASEALISVGPLAAYPFAYPVARISIRCRDQQALGGASLTGVSVWICRIVRLLGSISSPDCSRRPAWRPEAPGLWGLGAGRWVSSGATSDSDMRKEWNGMEWLVSRWLVALVIVGWFVGFVGG